MMSELVTTRQFRKDYKRVKKRGYNMKLLEEVIDLLLIEQELNECYHDHGLIGNDAGFRECHILPDWILNCIITHPALQSRMGIHLTITPPTPSHSPESLSLLPG